MTAQIHRKKSQKQTTVLLASGASGGHLFPALAVAEELRNQGCRCIFVLGGGKFGEHVTKAGFELVRLPAGAFNVRNPVRILIALLKLIRGFFKALALVWKQQPAVVLGTGGYASVATVLAAKCIGIPTMAHEQNVLPGRANKLLAHVVDDMLLTFPQSAAYFPKGTPTRQIGMPLRASVREGLKNTRTEDGTFRILVLGGSMGARILSRVIPEAIALMTEEERKNLVIMQQTRPEDTESVLSFYAPLGLAGVEVSSFFDDLPNKYTRTHLIVGRSGTGTVLEGAAYGRAAIYIPHQMADGHQLLNAQVAEEAGAAVVLEQPLFTPNNLLAQIRAIRNDDAKRQQMEASARSLSDGDAATRVAQQVLAMAKADVPQGGA